MCAFHVQMYTMAMPIPCKFQNSVMNSPDLDVDDCEQQCSFWELNQAHLQELLVLLFTELLHPISS